MIWCPFCLDFPKEDVTTMSRPCQRQPEWCRFNPFVPCETEMATAMTYCLSVVPNHSMPGAKKAFFMCDLSAAGDVSKWSCQKHIALSVCVDFMYFGALLDGFPCYDGNYVFTDINRPWYLAEFWQVCRPHPSLTWSSERSVKTRWRVEASNQIQVGCRFWNSFWWVELLDLHAIAISQASLTKWSTSWIFWRPSRGPAKTLRLYAYPSLVCKLTYFHPANNWRSEFQWLFYQLVFRSNFPLKKSGDSLCSAMFCLFLQVRHCCFIIGPTGAGKTEIWRSLEMSLIAIGEDCRWEQVNPKAITADELYGIFQKAVARWWFWMVLVVLDANLKWILGSYVVLWCLMMFYVSWSEVGSQSDISWKNCWLQRVLLQKRETTGRANGKMARFPWSCGTWARHCDWVGESATPRVRSWSHQCRSWSGHQGIGVSKHRIWRRVPLPDIDGVIITHSWGFAQFDGYYHPLSPHLQAVPIIFLMSTGDWRLQKHPSAQMGRLGRRHRCDVDRIHEHRHGRQQGRARLCCRSETCNHPTKQLPKYQQKNVF